MYLGEYQLTYRKPQATTQAPGRIYNSADLSKYFRQTIPDTETREEVTVIFLNRNNTPLGFYRAGIGGITGAVADLRLILAAALQIPCTGIALCHNHPSGNLQPSRGDRELTDNLKKAAALLSINLVDHIILSDTGYYSFADEGEI